MVVWIQNPFDNLPAEGYRKQRYWLVCEAEFDAVRIYDDYVSRVSQIVQGHPKSV